MLYLRNGRSWSSRMPLSAVLFDFNGVLFWDTPLHEEAWRRVATYLRGFALSDEEMLQHVHGRVNQDIFSYVLDRPVGLRECGDIVRGEGGDLP